MAEYDNTNRGALFKNDKKAAETHADWNGKINIDGADYYLNAWIKESKTGGGKFFSLSVKPVVERAKPAPAPRPTARRVEMDLNDEVPF